MKKRIAFIWFLLPVILMAQSTNVDSLVNVLNTKDLIASEKLALYYKIFNGYVYNDPEEASKYAERGIALAKKENDKRMLSNFHAAFGILYNTKSDYETALEYWEKALHWAQKAKDKELEANTYIGIDLSSG